MGHKGRRYKAERVILAKEGRSLTMGINKFSGQLAMWPHWLMTWTYQRVTLHEIFIFYMGLPWWLSGKESTCQWRRRRFHSVGSGWFPGEGNGNPLQYSFQRNATDRGAWQATVRGVARGRHDLVTEQQQRHFMLYLWRIKSAFLFY